MQMVVVRTLSLAGANTNEWPIGTLISLFIVDIDPNVGSCIDFYHVCFEWSFARHSNHFCVITTIQPHPRPPTTTACHFHQVDRRVCRFESHHWFLGSRRAATGCNYLEICGICGRSCWRLCIQTRITRGRQETLSRSAKKKTKWNRNRFALRISTFTSVMELSFASSVGSGAENQPYYRAWLGTCDRLADTYVLGGISA